MLGAGVVAAQAGRIYRFDGEAGWAAGDEAALQALFTHYDRFRIRIVKGASYQPAEGEAMTKGLLQRVGDGHVTLEFVDRIERTASGKFRALVCNLPALPKP